MAAKYIVVKVSSTAYEVVSVSLTDEGTLVSPTENGSGFNGSVALTATTAGLANTAAKALNQYYGY